MEAMIDGVLLTPLKWVEDERGCVMHLMSTARAPFVSFGEVYLSGVNPGVTKGWKQHTSTTGNLAVVVGEITFSLIDQRPDSPTHGVQQQVTLAAVTERYQLLTIPPGVCYAWRNAGQERALLANVSSEPWREGEAITVPLETHPF